MNALLKGQGKIKGSVYDRPEVVRNGARLMAKITSKGQVTIPKAIRRELGIREGDTVTFRLEGQHAVVTRIPDLMELAGSVEVPEDKRGRSWDEIRNITRRKRAEKWAEKWA